VITDFLPTRYCVAGNTEVIDHAGQTTEQQDIVIYDQHFCPLFFDEGGITKVPAESVYAVFEVKPELDKGVIEYAMEKAASVRRLERTNVEITDRGERKPPRKPFEIVAGVLALDSGWSPPFGDAFEKALAYNDRVYRLQLVCALRHGLARSSRRLSLVLSLGSVGSRCPETTARADPPVWSALVVSGRLPAP
jgi:Domain of unknown function (DUF6602)